MSVLEVPVESWHIGYPKIDTLFERDKETFRVVEEYRVQEATLITRWLVTEKIDGTNVRIFRNPDGEVSYGGRTDNAQMPATLVQHLLEVLPAEKVNAAFDDDSFAILFGEGYGSKIQSGGGYNESTGFRLFDVVVFGENGHLWWLNWPDVEDVARKLDVKTVPVLAEQAPLGEAIDLHSGPSVLAIEEGPDADPPREREGIVARTNPLLLDRRSRRLMWKLKVRDFTEGKR